MNVDIMVFSDGEQLSHAAARYVVQVANEALAEHGHFTIALSGGSTPKKLYSLLALEPYRNQIDWTKVEIFWADERCVPPDDAESNFHLAHEVMLSKLPIPAGQIHRMPADDSDRVAASAAYEQPRKPTLFGPFWRETISRKNIPRRLCIPRRVR